MSDYKISFVSVPLGRRISFNEYCGIRGEFMSADQLIVACSIIAKHPQDFPCLQIVTRSGDCIITSKVVFKAHRV